MLHYLSPMEIVLWACIAAGQSILAFLLLRSAAIYRYPAFCCYVFYGTLKSYLLLYIAASFSTIVYFWSYYPASFLGCLLMVPVVMEIFLKVYGSSRALPSGTIARLRRWLLACGVSALVAGAAFQMGHDASATYRAMATVERMLISGVLASLLVLLAYSTRLGLSWRTRIAGVAIGFVLFLSFNVVSAFSQANASPEVARIFRGSGQFSYLLVFIYWCWRFRKYEPAVQLSTEQTQSIRDELMRTTQGGPQGIRTQGNSAG